MTRSRFSISGHGFQHMEGQLPLPLQSSNVFRSAATPHIGAQLLRPASRPGSITLTRYDAANRLIPNRDLYLATINNTVEIIQDDVPYLWLPYQLRFFVTHVEIITADLIVRACRHYDGVAYDYAPASRVISKWTLYAIPAW